MSSSTQPSSWQRAGVTAPSRLQLSTGSCSTWTHTKLPDELSLHSHPSKRVSSQLSTTQPNSTSSGADPETNNKRARLTPVASERQRLPVETRPAPLVTGLPACINTRRDEPHGKAGPGVAQVHSTDSLDELHDESSPGTGSRVIPGSGATDRPGSGWLRRRAALSRVGGALSLSPHLTPPTKSRPRPRAVTATHQQPRRAEQ